MICSELKQGSTSLLLGEKRNLVYLANGGGSAPKPAAAR
jgi:hypothetical protein